MLHRLFHYFRSDLAVDLGTANTLVSIVGEGLVLDEPSVVAVQPQSGRILSGGCAVGHLAKQMQGRTPDSISVVRPLASGVITDFELCEAMLRYFLRKARPPGPRLKPRVLVAVPGCITPVEKRAVYNSFQRAGAGQVWLLSQSKAAAIGVGLPTAEPVASMVCDIGGGTS
jgi:rod shape-determining protein MreB